MTFGVLLKLQHLKKFSINDKYCSVIYRDVACYVHDECVFLLTYGKYNVPVKVR